MVGRRRAAAETAAKAKISVREAKEDDLDALVALEVRCFESDRLSRRRLKHLLTRAHAIFVVAEVAGVIGGYALVLLHGRTSLARLYSLAVDPACRGLGLGRRLLAESEGRARDAGCAVLRLEVREDNATAIALYNSAGYRKFAVVADYYEDHEPALRMEKTLAGGPSRELSRVPFYPQTLEFTCGPASLLMAMQALEPRRRPDRKQEIALWRESTSIFMTSGHGGCGPKGLALAAWARGFDVEVYVTETGPPFLDSVRSEEKKQVIRVVHEDFEERVNEAGIPSFTHGLSSADLAEFVAEGAVPIVLISSYRIYGEKNPHWVVVTGADDRFIYIHDPFVDWEEGKTSTDCLNVPIARAEFDRMARYGSARLRSAVVVKGRRKKGKG